jgi:hypothetical protein
VDARTFAVGMGDTESDVERALFASERCESRDRRAANRCQRL